MKSKQDTSECQRGFTLVELVGVLIITGILAIVALPRFFNPVTFDSRSYHDRALGMLRYAQKAAIARRALVFVRMNGTSIAICYDAACSRPVPTPAGTNSVKERAACGGNPAWLCEGVPPGVAYASADEGGVSFNANNASFFFDGLGKPYVTGDAPPNSTFNGPLVITFNGDGMARKIFVERETGYVHP